MRGILVGLGDHGHRWFEVCRKHSDVDLVGFVARSEQSRARAATEWGVPGGRLFGSLQESIDETGPDFVLDVSPPAAHKEIALTTFQAGLPLLQEKPMSNSWSDAKTIVEEGSRAGCLHMVAQNRRFGRLPRTTRSLLAQEVIGKPGQLTITFFVAWADSAGTHYVRDPYMFLIDMGCHHFDTMRYVFNAEALAAQSVSWNLPWGWHAGDAAHVIAFDFSGGLKALHIGLGCSMGEPTGWDGSWRIDGPRGSLTWKGGELYVTQVHGVPEKRSERIDLAPPLAEDTLTAVMNEFIRALREDSEPECSSRDNLETMAMVFAAVRSAQEGRRIALSELKGTAGD